MSRDPPMTSQTPNPAGRPRNIPVGMAVFGCACLIASSLSAQTGSKPRVLPRAGSSLRQPAVRALPAPHSAGQPGSATPAPPTAAGGAAQVPPQPGPAASQMRAAAPLVNPSHPAQTQQHLAEWIETHRNLPPDQQQHALENEPGFRNLPPGEQQRLHQRLTQLNAMPPQQRQKVIERNEAMERLAPAQRQQVRNAMAQLGSLPDDRKHVVARMFYQLRDLPPAQRQAYLNSGQFHTQFNDAERGTINGLLDVTPIYGPLQPQPR